MCFYLKGMDTNRILPLLIDSIGIGRKWDVVCFGSHQFLCQHLSILIRFLFQQSRSEKRIKEKWNQDTKIHAAISKERFCRIYQFSTGNWLWKGVNTIYVWFFLLQGKEYIRCCNECFKNEHSGNFQYIGYLKKFEI